MAELYRALLACVLRALPTDAAAAPALPPEDEESSYGPLTDAAPAFWQLTASMLSGKEAKICVSSTAAVSELVGIIEQALQVPASRQELVLPSGTILLRPGARHDEEKTLAEAGVTDGDSIVVVHVAWLPPTLPSKFSLTLTSVRERVFPLYSSAFVICYEIEVDLPAGRVDVKLWRKNDHDTRSYDFGAGTVEGSHQHWMTGSTPFAHRLQDAGGGATLEELFQRWLAKPTPALAGEPFWQTPSPQPEEEEEDVSIAGRRKAWSSGRRGADAASPARRPKWFEVPELGDFVELQVDLPFFNNRRLGRVLVDASGMPVRAALMEGHATPMHDAVEEFDVKWKEM